MALTGSSYRAIRSGSSKAAMAKRTSSGRGGGCFWPLTPVALRAPSVSGQKHSHKRRISDESRQRKQAKLLTDVDQYFTLKEPCVASLRSDRHQIGMADRHHRNAQERKIQAENRL